MLQSSDSSRRVRDGLFLFDPSNGESRVSAYKLEVSDVFRVFDVKGVCLRLFVLVQASNNTPRGSFPWGKVVLGQGRNVSLA